LNKFFLFLSVSLFLISLGNSALAQSDDKLVVLETSQGTIVIEFFSEDAPKHIANFVGLTESGFYDGVLFHRIIPGFMIQGGDPNTIDGDPSTWGTGGPSTSVDAEFNTIKHNRGIVSMARSADPNSGGSQFFIVHADSNFLDEQYTVFGRIVTDESFETLDKIASVEIGSQDRPQNPEQVKITKATTISRSEISNLLELGEPERTQTTITPSSGNQKYESDEHEIAITVPEGWLLQTPDKTEANSPDVVAVGPKTGLMNPVISLTVQETGDRTLRELISEKTETLQEILESGNLRIISQNETIINGMDVYVIEAEGDFSSNGQEMNVKFKEVLFYDTEKFYTLAYSNGVEEFESQLPRFEETIDTFEILSENIANEQSMNGLSTEEGGGCLIATATFGSELAPQVQQLRELRDNSILTTASGTAFMTGFNQFYYSFSPTIADLERENPVFKEAVKITLTPLLTSLSILNHVDMDSEESVLGYGISLIILNLGMYLAAPAIIIYKIRK
jgi:peptidyl-prolyl cis-trans isomerase B (cyclophilin B)